MKYIYIYELQASTLHITMRLRCVKTGEETYLSYILSDKLHKTFEIIEIKGRVCVKIRSFKNAKKKSQLSIANYHRELEKATRQCKTILLLAPYEEKDTDGNIFCPFHENKNYSKTPSARLYTCTNSFVCFSTKCKKKCTSLYLLQFLLNQGR